MINRILALLAISTVASYGAANDLLIAQRNSTDTGQLTRLVAHPGGGQNGLVVYNGTTLLPQIILVGDGLNWSSGTLSTTITSAMQAEFDAKQDTITTATSSDYYRGDKTWQSLNKSAVGLSNVDNTADSAKPVSTATQSALDAKASISSISAAGFSGSYVDLSNKPTLGTAASANSSSFATAAQGAKADSAVQPTGSSGQYIAGNGSFVTFPTIPASPVNADWSSGSGLSQILNKPTLGTAAAQNSTAFATATQGAKADTALQSTYAGSSNIVTVGTIATGVWQGTAIADSYIASAATWNGKLSPTGNGSGLIGLTKSQVGLSNVDNTSDASKPISTATQTALNGKEPTIASGTTSQYWRGDKTWQTLPTSPSYSTSTVSRSLNTAFVPSATRPAFVNYTVDIVATITLTGGQTGTVFLETSPDNSTWTTILSGTSGNTGALTIGLSLTSTGTVTLSGFVPANYYARIRTANTTGTPSFSYRSGLETLS